MKTILKLILFITAFIAGAKTIEVFNKQKNSWKFEEDDDEDIEDFPHFISKPIGKNKYVWKNFFKEKKVAVAGLILLAIFAIESPMLRNYSYMFRASLLGEKHIEFIGTTSPVEKVPNWTALSNAERTMTYSQIPQSKFITIPDYDLSSFQAGQTWNGNDPQRNAYITFPVPYMGNYELDASENSGSHLGIDIKIPKETPIRSIANGIVYKVKNETTGFGKHITIMHPSVPDPENPGQKTTLYSTYAHLSATIVNVSDEVTKGQVIGKSGDSGMATAPHLHFQIDRSDAPFIPYWPFTWEDIQQAGYNSYFDGVRYGIGKSNALKYTVHPMDFIVQNQQYIPVNQVVSTDDSVVVEIPIQPEPTPVVITTPAIENVTESPTVVLSSNNIVFENIGNYVPGEAKTIQVRIDTPQLLASNGIRLDSTLRDLATIDPTTLYQDDFKDGTAEIIVKTNTTHSFKLIATGDFGEIKSSSLRAQVFKDIDPGYKHAPAIQYLKNNNIVNGYPDGTFRPDGNLNRAEAVKILLIGNNISAENEPNRFDDVPASAWFANYVNTAAEKGIVKGYNDGEFKPANKISRAEFLKVSILTAGMTIPKSIARNPYDDVDRDAWFAVYFDFAKSHNLLAAKRGGYMVPSQPITRSEAAEIMYKLSKIKSL